MEWITNEFKDVTQSNAALLVPFSFTTHHIVTHLEVRCFDPFPYEGSVPPSVPSCVVDARGRGRVELEIYLTPFVETLVAPFLFCPYQQLIMPTVPWVVISDSGVNCLLPND